MIRGLVSAIRTLTIIPVFGRDADDFSSSVKWFCLVGFALGVFIVCFIKLSLMFTSWHSIIALFAVFLGAFLTRGIHLDGLADFADGFFGGSTKEKILTIMKDSAIGTFGALSLIFILFAKWIAVLKMTEQNTFILIVPAYVTSRFAMSYLTSTMPYARAGGGTGRPFVENAKTSDAVVAFIFAVVLNFAVAGVIGVLMLLAGLFAAFLLKLFYMKKVGGVTGDLLGAASEMIETILLIFGALIGAHAGVFRF